jgi:methionine-rich copper-binding protein CopC
MVSGSPSSVRTWFDGYLEPVFSAIHVQDRGGENVDKNDGHINAADPTLLEESLPLLLSGTYRVLWYVVARNGHWTKGYFSLTFK